MGAFLIGQWENPSVLAKHLGAAKLDMRIVPHCPGGITGYFAKGLLQNHICPVSVLGTNIALKKDTILIQVTFPPG